jgi:starvation-inducible outer membrane lipoprotein
MTLSSQEITVIGTLGGAVVGALATITVTWLNLSRAHHARVWDLRRQAYGAIISEISAIQRINDVAEIRLSEDPIGYFEGNAQ